MRVITIKVMVESDEDAVVDAVRDDLAFLILDSLDATGDGTYLYANSNEPTPDDVRMFEERKSEQE